MDDLGDSGHNKPNASEGSSSFSGGDSESESWMWCEPAPRMGGRVPFWVVPSLKLLSDSEMIQQSQPQTSRKTTTMCCKQLTNLFIKGSPRNHFFSIHEYVYTS